MHNQNNILKHNIEAMRVKLDKNDIEMKQLKEQLRTAPKSVEAISQESAMEIGDSQEDKSNDVQEAQILKQMKQSGYQRVSPVVSPEKKSEEFVCDTCGYIYEDKERLRHHIQQSHLTKVQTVVKPPEMRIESKMMKYFWDQNDEIFLD